MCSDRPDDWLRCRENVFSVSTTHNTITILLSEILSVVFKIVSYHGIRDVFPRYLYAFFLFYTFHVVTLCVRSRLEYTYDIRD